MRIPRIFNSKRLSVHGALELEPDASGHILRVLRLKPGDALVVFDGRGGEHPGRLIAARGDTAVVELDSGIFPGRESPLHTNLVLPVLRGRKMDLTIQKATELGVTVIRTYFSERGLVQLDGSRLAKRLDHWRRVAVGATEQSGRTRPPQVEAPLSLETVLRSLQPGGTRLVFAAGEKGLSTSHAGENIISLITGPEGGLSESEMATACGLGFEAVSLGPRTLRTETAPLVALSLLQFLGKGLEPLEDG